MSVRPLRIAKWPTKKRGEESLGNQTVSSSSFKRPYRKFEDDYEQNEQHIAPTAGKAQPHNTEEAIVEDHSIAKPKRFTVYRIVANTVDTGLEFHMQTTAYKDRACRSLRALLEARGGRHQLAVFCMGNAMMHGQQTMINTLVSSYKWPVDSEGGIVVLHTRVTTRAKKQGTCSLCDRCICQVEYDDKEEGEDLEQDYLDFQDEEQTAAPNVPNNENWHA
ncbi:hypothetical protein TWF718_009692 [Orbilia javanica]|uniref:Uncharacterized protein n=1 Tax=Orbilia javanica TaxID=47235 RepID=A0AAN8MKL0_9PEZI